LIRLRIRRRIAKKHDGAEELLLSTELIMDAAFLQHKKWNYAGASPIAFLHANVVI